MSESESSFNATGPSVVGFETTSADTPVLQQFGVSVVGTKCGVYGQGTSGAQKDRRVAPLGAGVCGRGEVEGVYGIGDAQGVLGVSASVDDNGDTPDFSSSSTPEGMGVIGISGARSQGDPTLAKDPFNGYFNAPAVVGDNNVLNSDLSKLSVLGNNVTTEIRTLPVGVEGISWSGLGVYGISFNLDPEKKTNPTKDPRVQHTASDAILDAIEPYPTINRTAPAGVLGLSMQGAGVRGVSRFDRGGIFQSATVRMDDPLPLPGFHGPTDPVVAQIRLVPHRVYGTDPHTNNPQLPRNGETGDLLVVVSPTRNRQNSLEFQTATLWFCERGNSIAAGAGPAVWRKVSLADSVTGS